VREIVDVREKVWRGREEGSHELASLERKYGDRISELEERVS